MMSLQDNALELQSVFAGCAVLHAIALLVFHSTRPTDANEPVSCCGPKGSVDLSQYDRYRPDLIGSVVMYCPTDLIPVPESEEGLEMEDLETLKMIEDTFTRVRRRINVASVCRGYPAPACCSSCSSRPEPLAPLVTLMHTRVLGYRRAV